MHGRCYWPIGKVEVVYILTYCIYRVKVSEVKRLSERETNTEEAGKKLYTER